MNGVIIYISICALHEVKITMCPKIYESKQRVSKYLLFYKTLNDQSLSNCLAWVVLVLMAANHQVVLDVVVQSRHQLLDGAGRRRRNNL